MQSTQRTACSVECTDGRVQGAQCRVHSVQYEVLDRTVHSERAVCSVNDMKDCPVLSRSTSGCTGFVSVVAVGDWKGDGGSPRVVSG